MNVKYISNIRILNNHNLVCIFINILINTFFKGLKRPLIFVCNNDIKRSNEPGHV